MKTIDKNDPAFSLHPEVNPYGVSSGLTKREYFAALASDGFNDIPESFYRQMLAEFDKESGNKRDTKSHPIVLMNISERIKTKAAWKVAQADALIEALNREEK